MLGRRIFAGTSFSGRDRSYDRSRALSRLGDYARDGLGWAGVALLLFAMVVAAIAGAQTAFLLALLAAWLLFPLLVGLRRTLDAGCAFMLIAVGVIVVVALARNGPGSLFP